MPLNALPPWTPRKSATEAPVRAVQPERARLQPRQLFSTAPLQLAVYAGRFALIGLSGSALNFVILVALHHGLGWPVVPANAVGYTAGIGNNYALNRYWNYRRRTHGHVLVQAGWYGTISVAGLVIHSTTLWIGIRLGLRDLVAFGAATLAAYLWNFTVNHTVTFRQQADRCQTNSQSAGVAARDRPQAVAAGTSRTNPPLSGAHPVAKE